MRRVFKELNVLFQSEKVEVIRATKISIRLNIRALEEYLLSHSKLVHNLHPVSIEATPPKLVNIIAESTRPLNIGSIAAVAGALACLVVELMREVNDKVIIVENVENI